MKILAIQTSPNYNGLTASTANSILNGAKSNGHEVELINLNDHIIKKCKACETGWGECRSKGECILEDDFQKLREKIDESDFLVFTTPVYWHDISESAKTFLDRLRRCETHYNFQRYTDKTAIGIAAAGGSGNGAARALYLLEDYIKRLGFNIFDLVTVTQKNKSHKLPMLEEAGKLI
ncbi:flavodoxin family protein [Candidatus Bathyarchaeota archaeon]|jgi:multimeric flavodoxin WrbA|nr:flavodoxin family protein [Candidatus Bathyarchaeota archaeon]